MAACVSEQEILNRTLSGLRSTSKGQLKYSGASGFEDDSSGIFSYSLESFINRSSESLPFLNRKKTTEGHLVDSSSPTKAKRLECEAGTGKVRESCNSYREERKEKYLGIAVNIESEIEFALQEYHKECRELAESRKEMRVKIFNRRTRNLKRDTEEQLKINQKHLIEEKQKYECLVAERIRNEEEDYKKRKEEMDEKVKEHKRILDEINTRALIEESHMAQQEEEKRIALEDLKKNIAAIYQQALKNVKVIQNKFEEFQHMSFVDSKVHQNVMSDLAVIISKAREETGKSKTFTDLSVAENSFQVMNKLIEKIIAIDSKVTHTLNLAGEKSLHAALKKKEMEEAAKIKNEEFKKEQLRKAEIDSKASKTTVSATPVKISSGSKKSVDIPSSDSDLVSARCISNKAFTEYLKLQEKLKGVQDSFKDFASDPKNTKYKFDLQKAINVPINALSAHSPSHLNDKIHRLVSLLTGRNVTVGGKSVNCKQHPTALVFCKDLVAKKLVMQGAQQVSSNPASAFIYAAVIVGIWSAFPDVGELILAHFHHSYPYLVPYYMPQEDGQSTNDYHKALGYSIIGDKIEDQDKFLKKFSGTVQLYAAILSTSSATEPDHPHGVNWGWMWLARILNLKPQASITATMLYEFIKIASHLLMKKYGKQFQKLLLVLCKDFVPAIDKVTPSDKRGPTQRLKDFLEECIRSQQIPVPEGYLTQQWWQSGHF